MKTEKRRWEEKKIRKRKRKRNMRYSSIRSSRSWWRWSRLKEGNRRREEEGKDVGQGGEESLKYAQYSVINVNTIKIIRIWIKLHNFYITRIWIRILPRPKRRNHKQ